MGPSKVVLREQWDYRLTNHTPTKDGIRRIEALRSAAKAMKDAIIDLTPPGREQSLALTKNEEMLFYANGAVAREFTNDNPNLEGDNAEGEQ